MGSRPHQRQPSGSISQQGRRPESYQATVIARATQTTTASETEARAEQESKQRGYPDMQTYIDNTFLAFLYNHKSSDKTPSPFGPVSVTTGTYYSSCRITVSVKALLTLE